MHQSIYRADREPEAASGWRVLRVFWRCPAGLVGTVYTQSNSDFMENPCFEKLADFSRVMWICGGLAPCGPSVLLATKKASFGMKTCHSAIPRIMGQKSAQTFTNRFLIILPFMGQKVIFWVKKTVFWGGLDRV